MHQIGQNHRLLSGVLLAILSCECLVEQMQWIFAPPPCNAETKYLEITRTQGLRARAAARGLKVSQREELAPA